MGKGLGERQKALLGWIQEQASELASGGSYSSGNQYRYRAPAGSEQVGVPRHRLAQTYLGEEATASSLEAVRRSLRTLQDRNLIADRSIKLVTTTSFSRAGSEVEHLKERDIWCYCLQGEGDAPQERWKVDPSRVTFGQVYREALLAHVTTESQDWQELEPKMLATAVEVAKARLGERFRPWCWPDRDRLVEMRGYLQRKGHLLVSGQVRDPRDYRRCCTVSLHT
jgi:hypothetical protein